MRIFSISDKQIWKISELEKLSAEEFYKFLDEIPSDNESVQTDCHSDEEETFDLTQDENSAKQAALALDNSDDGLDYDSEDNLPLATFLPNLAAVPNFHWSQNVNNFITKVPFTELSGPNGFPDNDETPLQFFMTLFSEELLQEIVFQTNLYATQKNVGNSHVPTNEMKCFLGINIMMGIKSLPATRTSGHHVLS
ncbi:unnamed protein product [Acanthoscelides obtectus]|uniref:PiggyBac transposable element-derived protein domain-containing protein n=1 Tax=Acanthoscelides obtectus TaxID=200917 RepID=A0A9P0P9E0_ACAOB|nr:unnamed protein product [Acanthoscelides obtectus]CAK1633080.1 hypothetical protein AOBTE_LOCUS7933 [Acanthoscelides obtectus]